jgi:Icc-related predicted phosphoesterase
MVRRKAVVLPGQALLWSWEKTGEKERNHSMAEQPFWIAVGDLHGQADQIGRIPDISTAQGVLVSGDITNRGSRATAAKILDEIARFNERIYAQIGNMDTREVADLLDEREINVHGRLADLGSGVRLLGMGYSTPTPFGTPSEVSDEQLRIWLEDILGEDTDRKQLIFMPHNPPFGTLVDRVQSGQSVGSRSVRGFIETYQPAVCITGHIHESRAVDDLGATQIINPGCFRFGGYVRVAMAGETLTAELRQLELRH